jgi:lycopene cyclase domain-containing protein
VDRFQYLIVMALCVLITLPLEFVLNARVYRRPRRLLRTMVPAFAAFVAWDVVAIRLGHWTFSPTYTTGWKIGNIPIEELVFFIVIPLCALLSYEAVRNILRDGWVGTLRAGSLGRFLPAPDAGRTTVSRPRATPATPENPSPREREVV